MDDEILNSIRKVLSAYNQGLKEITTELRARLYSGEPTIEVDILIDRIQTIYKNVGDAYSEILDKVQ